MILFILISKITICVAVHINWVGGFRNNYGGTVLFEKIA